MCVWQIQHIHTHNFNLPEFSPEREKQQRLTLLEAKELPFRQSLQNQAKSTKPGRQSVSQCCKCSALFSVQFSLHTRQNQAVVKFRVCCCWVCLRFCGGNWKTESAAADASGGASLHYILRCCWVLLDNNSDFACHLLLLKCVCLVKSPSLEEEEKEKKEKRGWWQERRRGSRCH